MTKRIFRSICIVALAVLVATVGLFMFILYNEFSGNQVEQLKMQTDMAAQGVDIAGENYFDGLDTEKYRITWINKDGTVLYDSHSDSDEMENHLEREEIKEAFDSGIGESKRYSDTVMMRSLYYAQRLSDGTVIRLSISQRTILTLLIGMIYPILLIVVLALLMSVALAITLSKSIVEPLNTIDLEKPLENDGYDELSPLLRRIDSQQKQLKQQSEKLQKKKNELDAVVENMNEGIVLLSSHSHIISINPMAMKLLEADESCIGEDILTVCRNLSVQKLLKKAQKGESAEKLMDLQGGRYQVNANPIISNDRISGIALLFFDVTEKENAEEMRREFTANVSHELKTPLHSITGYAELMTNGMVKPEDYGTFSEKIYTEAKRMVRLVEDIISLSHLDEGAADMLPEEVDLCILANEAVKSLDSTAKAAEVSLTLEGESVMLSGIPHLLQGIIYNLCDNAIKYNRKGGSVTVKVASGEDEAVLTVSDNGIGIPAEHQNRIFERFYRVDKSHSKEVGGTGLGLSIVKHAASIHNAKIELVSVPSEGTTVTVRFPMQ